MNETKFYQEIVIDNANELGYLLAHLQRRERLILARSNRGIKVSIQRNTPAVLNQIRERMQIGGGENG